MRGGSYLLLVPLPLLSLSGAPTPIFTIVPFLGFYFNLFIRLVLSLGLLPLTITQFLGWSRTGAPTPNTVGFLFFIILGLPYSLLK